MQSIVSLFSGLIFGFGLIISGMTQPGKVIGFLDIFGAWQWDLMGVMGGALVSHALTRFLVLKRDKPVYAEHFPQFKQQIDSRLLIGAIFFGLGWGIAGFCPGPAIVSLATFNPSIIIFILTMTLGMLLAKRLLSTVEV